MSKEKNKLLTIGQFASLHKINKKTLMWYDEIGLLKPAFIKENGYRYYSYQQSSILETILILRELNISLPEIKSFMKQRSAENLNKLLDEKIIELHDTISHLKSIQKTLSHYKENITSIMNIDLSKISLVYKEESYLVCVNSNPTLSFEKELELIISEAKNYNLHRLHNATYGSMISTDKLYKNNFTDYDALFIEVPKSSAKKGLHKHPSGMYLRAFCKGNWDKIPNKYKEILDYAKANHITLCGCAYETGINELMIDDINEYITQIEIPVQVNESL